MISTELQDENSFYDNNAALEGGVFYLENSVIQVLNTVITNSYALNGGVFYELNTCLTILNNTNFTNNNAVKNGGLIYITELDPTLVKF